MKIKKNIEKDGKVDEERGGEEEQWKRERERSGEVLSLVKQRNKESKGYYKEEGLISTKVNGRKRSRKSGKCKIDTQQKIYKEDQRMGNQRE